MTIMVAVLVTGIWLRAQIAEDAGFVTDGGATDEQTISLIARSPGSRRPVIEGCCTLVELPIV